jgi:antitoxin (DNA-binding transcriptional repressor) of toxin-antitoxin stability system
LYNSSEHPQKSYIQVSRFLLEVIFTGSCRMQKISLKEAEAKLAALIESAASGEEVVITRSDGASFKIVPIIAADAIPKFGSAKGLIKMSDDFDEPLEDFEEYAP